MKMIQPKKITKTELLKEIRKKSKQKGFIVISITGTPGTGKTTLSKYIKNKISTQKRKIKVISIKKIVKKNTKEYDKENKCWVISEKKLEKILNKLILEEKKKYKEKHQNKNINHIIILDGHMSHYVTNKFVDFVVVMKSKIETLAKRLKRRKYSLNKIKENIEAEIFNVCLDESRERKHKIFVIWT